MKKTLLIIFTLLTLIFNLEAHPFYVSVTQIDYKDNSLQITLKIFIEDLENTLEDNGKPKLNLGEKNEINNANDLIRSYLSQSFKVKINNDEKVYNYVGKETEEDAVWIYLEIADIKSINKLEVKNTIITEKYEGQTNLVHTNINGEKKSMILNRSKPSDILTY